MALIKHVECDNKGVTRLGCMLCNDTIGTRDYLRDMDGSFVVDVKGEKVPYLRHWSHIRFVEYYLSDGSFTDMLVCKDCAPKLADGDTLHLEQQMVFGWLTEAHKVLGNHNAVMEHHRNLKIISKGRTHDLESRLTRTWQRTA